MGTIKIMQAFVLVAAGRSTRKWNAFYAATVGLGAGGV
jgi:hypothetical protein